MPQSKFSQIDKNIEKSRFADFDRSMAMTKQIFNQIRRNAKGSPEGAWFNRKPGQEAIYAEPRNEILQSASSGTWKAPLMKLMKYLGEEGGTTLKNVAKEAQLSQYEYETLEELIKINREAGWTLPKSSGTGGK